MDFMISGEITKLLRSLCSAAETVSGCGMDGCRYYHTDLDTFRVAFSAKENISTRQSCCLCLCVLGTDTFISYV